MLNFFTNDFMVVPFMEHLRVFYKGILIAEVDSYEEAWNEIQEAQEKDSMNQ